MTMNKKQVSFEENEPLQVVENEDGITEEEEALQFYSRKELASIIEHCKLVVTGQVPMEDETTRGLELLSDKTSQRNHRKILVRQVLKEQSRQRLRRCESKQELCKVSQEFSLESLKLALARGKQDVKAAREGVWERIKAKRSSLRSSFRGTKVGGTTTNRKQELRTHQAIEITRT